MFRALMAIGLCSLWSGMGVTEAFASSTACVLISGIQRDSAGAFDPDRVAFFGGKDSDVKYKKIKWGAYDCIVVPTSTDLTLKDGSPNPKYFPAGTKNIIVSNYTHGHSGGEVTCDSGTVSGEDLSNTYLNLTRAFDQSFFFLNMCFGGDLLVNQYLKKIKDSGKVDLAKKSCVISLSSTGRVGSTSSNPSANASGILNPQQLPKPGESAVDFYLMKNRKQFIHPDALISSAMFSSVGLLNGDLPNTVDQTYDLLDKVFQYVRTPAATQNCNGDRFSKELSCFSPVMTDEMTDQLIYLSALTSVGKTELELMIRAANNLIQWYPQDPERARLNNELSQGVRIEPLIKSLEIIRDAIRSLSQKSENERLIDLSQLAAVIADPAFIAEAKALQRTPSEHWKLVASRIYGELFSDINKAGHEHPATNAARFLSDPSHLQNPKTIVNSLGLTQEGNDFPSWVKAAARSSMGARCQSFKQNKGAQYRYLMAELLSNHEFMSFKGRDIPQVMLKGLGKSVLDELDDQKGELGYSAILPRFSRATAKVPKGERDAFDQATLEGCLKKFPPR